MDSREAHCVLEGQWDMKGSQPRELAEQQNTLGILADLNVCGWGSGWDTLCL